MGQNKLISETWKNLMLWRFLQLQVLLLFHLSKVLIFYCTTFWVSYAIILFGLRLFSIYRKIFWNLNFQKWKRANSEFNKQKWGTWWHYVCPYWVTLLNDIANANGLFRTNFWLVFNLFRKLCQAKDCVIWKFYWIMELLNLWQ